MFFFCSLFFFFKQKTAYELRISDWSSDLCSSDLPTSCACGPRPTTSRGTAASVGTLSIRSRKRTAASGTRSGSCSATWRTSIPSGTAWRPRRRCRSTDRKRVVEGKGVSGRVKLGGGRAYKKKKKRQHRQNK